MHKNKTKKDMFEKNSFPANKNNNNILISKNARFVNSRSKSKHDFKKAFHPYWKQPIQDQNERNKCMKKKVPLGEIHLEGSLSKGA